VTSPEARRDIDELSTRIVNRREILVARGKQRTACERGSTDNTAPFLFQAAALRWSR